MEIEDNDICKAFDMVNEVAQQAIEGIINIVTMRRSSLNMLDEVLSVIKTRGTAYVGIGRGNGETKGMDAAKMAMEFPFLETTASKMKNVLLCLSGDVSSFDLNNAVDYIRNLAGDDVKILFNAIQKENIKDSCTAVIIVFESSN